MTSSQGAQWAGAAGFEELRREAEELRRRFDVGEDPSASYTGKDGSRTVRVTVDGNGCVRKVEIRRTWRDATGAEGLGAAVCEAYGDAVTQRLSAWGSAVADAENQPAVTREDDRRDAGRASDARTGSPVPPPSGDPVRQILDLLDRADSELGEFERRLAEHMEREVEVRSPGRHVTVALRAGQVSRVDIDQPWLRTGAHEYRIAAELQDAFQAAYDEARETSSPEALMGEGALAELQALSRNPRELFRRLGYDGPL